eukprot:CAMPEP_0179142380 /NCGR_PEP_ID=MMETSP0796-20121207/68374_1 /TAXON_ID=73915 /ORGANISM="Pyrodinium bahamense, Strain pbaha01" /LENGTH=32 /DNA_ID= /DNA_START= /DNA_END= /DNA_ORIENTATION=
MVNVPQDLWVKAHGRTPQDDVTEGSGTAQQNL